MSRFLLSFMLILVLVLSLVFAFAMQARAPDLEPDTQANERNEIEYITIEFIAIDDLNIVGAAILVRGPTPVHIDVRAPRQDLDAYLTNRARTSQSHPTPWSGTSRAGIPSRRLLPPCPL